MRTYKDYSLSLPLCLLIFVHINIITNLQAQDFEPEEYTSIRHEQSDFYEENGPESSDVMPTSIFEQLRSSFVPACSENSECGMKKQVYGYHPHWMGADTYQRYDYSLLTTFCYFGYDLNPYTGAYRDIHHWKTTQSVDLAKAAGNRVELAVTNFGGANNARFLNNKKAWTKLVDSLVELLDYRNADGVNIDFENVRKQQKASLTEFMRYLSKRLKTERPGSSVTMAVPGLNNYRIYDVAVLQEVVDAFVIMGYDYHYSRSKHAGPVAPLKGYLSLESTLRSYLCTGVDKSKLILAVPYYGREWQTKGHGVPSNSTAYVSSRTFAEIKSKYEGQYTEKWHIASATPYYVRGKAGSFKQCWFDSKQSIGRKYDLAMMEDIGGVGMWALGYDKGHTDLWDLLQEKFQVCGEEAKVLFASSNKQKTSNSKERKPLFKLLIDTYNRFVD
ncbi:MAG: glycosyl hydrolase family 18 protein [Chitinophagales bacterium]